MKITTIILTCDNESTIEKTLQSISGDILIGDIGSKDLTLSICKKYNTSIIEIPFENDYSKVKNKLISHVKSDWILHVEPWEVLVQANFEESDISKSYHLQIISNKIISKSIRFWHKSKSLSFVNPIFEIIDDNSHYLPSVIYAAPVIAKQQTDIINKWKKEKPTDSAPYYYEACVLLQEEKYDEFLSVAQKYLFLENMGLPVVMIKYYLAAVQLYIKKDVSSSLRNILPCIATKPNMAEFWCLLGDIYYHKKIYKKAQSFYKNAIYAGERRLKEDMWPLEIDKYRNHPNKMIKSCQKILDESNYIAAI